MRSRADAAQVARLGEKPRRFNGGGASRVRKRRKNTRRTKGGYSHVIPEPSCFAFEKVTFDNLPRWADS